ncbi:DUF2577 family protein [Fictibacillus nanhaiensis]|uniref:DUF2577 family protein n=1 Tax=Fictibacillus nanhaiensis TaxID=742169 RepID=UPI0020420389|nr:DUF2577 family protein [Fictibacillus nanhaiensis]MCM3730077.1 DUF2577 family protein [Fictibacillus nanhaiensis]
MGVSKLIQVLNEQSSKSVPTLFYVGKISSVSPLKVRTNEIELDNDQLKIINKQQIFSTLQTNNEVLLVRQGAVFIIVGKLEGVS